MTAPTYSPPEDLLKTVAEHVTREWPGLLEGQVPLGFLPDVTELVQAATVAFWSSLARNEGRQVTCSVVFSGPEPYVAREAHFPVVTYGDALLFHRNAPLDSETIRLLSPAVSAGDHLGVTRGKRGLEVWGIARGCPLACVVVQVAGAGLIRIKFRHLTDVLLAEIRGQSAAWTGAAVSALERLPLFGPIADERIRKVASLRAVIRSVHGLGHGGTILLVPGSGDAWRETVDKPRSDLAIPYPGIPRCTAELMSKWVAFDKWLETQKQDPQLPMEMVLTAQLSDRLQRTCQAVGQLTAVDGAVVLDQELQVLAFGAKITASAEKMISVAEESRRADESARCVPLDEIGGTRHQSAARFVFENHESFAVVCSQDGRVTIMYWDDDTGVIASKGEEAFLD